jgi:hypothetical protein
MSTGAIGKTNSPAPGTAIEIGIVDNSGKIQAVSSTTPLPITGTIVATNPSVAPTGAPVPPSATYEGMNVGGTLTGLGGTSNGLKVDVQASVLPTGAATASLQTSGNASLTSIDSKTATLGQKTMAGSEPVVIASDQSAVPVSGTVAATQSGAWTVTANAGTNLNTSALALDTSVTGLQVSQGSTTSGEKGPLIQGAVTTAAPSYTTAQTSPLSLTTTGALRTDASGSTQPVSGTVAATQSGTWTVQPGNTANTTPWLATISQGGNSATVSAGGALKTDGSASTQPVSGTVTANQGGAPWAENITQIGGASLTIGQQVKSASIPVVLASNSDAQGVTQSGTWSNRILDSNGASIALGQTSMASSLPVAIASNQSAIPVSGTVTANQGGAPWTVTGTGTAGTSATGVVTIQGIASGTAVPISGTVTATFASVGATGAAVPASADYAGMNVGGNLTGMTGTANGLKVDGSAVTQPVSGTVTANAGTGTFAVDPAQANVGSNGAVGSVTGSALTGAYATVVTPGFASRIVQIFNSCNNTIKVSLDGGTTDFFILEAFETSSLDLGTNGRKIAASTNLQAKHNGTAPTTGTIRITAIG